jgi:hypothetical protein
MYNLTTVFSQRAGGAQEPEVRRRRRPLITTNGCKCPDPRVRHGVAIGSTEIARPIWLHSGTQASARRHVRCLERGTRTSQARPRRYSYAPCAAPLCLPLHHQSFEVVCSPLQHIVHIHSFGFAATHILLSHSRFAATQSSLQRPFDDLKTRIHAPRSLNNNTPTLSICVTSLLWC